MLSTLGIRHAGTRSIHPERQQSTIRLKVFSSGFTFSGVGVVFLRRALLPARRFHNEVSSLSPSAAQDKSGCILGIRAGGSCVWRHRLRRHRNKWKQSRWSSSGLSACSGRIVLAFLSLSLSFASRLDRGDHAAVVWVVGFPSAMALHWCKGRYNALTIAFFGETHPSGGGAGVCREMRRSFRVENEWMNDDARPPMGSLSQCLDVWSHLG